MSVFLKSFLFAATLTGIVACQEEKPRKMLPSQSKTASKAETNQYLAGVWEKYGAELNSLTKKSLEEADGDGEHADEIFNESLEDIVKAHPDTFKIIGLEKGQLEEEDGTVTPINNMVIGIMKDSVVVKKYPLMIPSVISNAGEKITDKFLKKMQP